MIPSTHPSIRAELVRLLAPSRKRIHLSIVRRCLHLGRERALTAMLCVTVAFLIVVMASVLFGQPAPVGWGVYGFSMAVAAALPVLVAAIRGWRALPSLREAAERLDRAASDHNQVAIAVSLVEEGANSPFAHAATGHGLRQLRHIHNMRPFIDGDSAWRRTLGLAAAVIALNVTAWLCAHPIPRPAPSDTPALADRTDGVRQPGSNEAEKRQEQDTKPPPQSATPASRGSRSADAQSTPLALAALPNLASTGRAGGGSLPGARAADRSAHSGGEPTESSAPSVSARDEKPRRDGAKQPKSPEVQARGPGEAQSESSSVSQGASGGGSASPVHHAWSQRERSAEGEREDDTTEEDVEDESDSSQQRGGIQPALKDRNESPNRDLGISGEEGPPGTGRGGPTPPKKSRGTASLVLGVPIPDFVRGRIGPGTTKITHERVEPAPMPGDSSQPVPVQPRTLAEAPSRAFDVPPAFAGIVRRYLVALHSADAGPSGVASTAEAPPTTLSKESPGP